jgi:endoglucanase
MPGKNVPAIKVNTVGYEPSWQKLVVFNVEPVDAGVVDEQGRKVLAIDAGSYRSHGRDEASQDLVWIADVSAVREPGRYRITSSGAESDWFEVRAGIYSDVLRAAQKHYFFQRCRTTLERPHATFNGLEFLRKEPCHVHEDVGYLLADHPRKERKVHVKAGWHDAGNYEIYVATTAPTVQALLTAYEVNDKLFRDGDLTIPESGNGVPDILDEAEWGIRWLLSMQGQKGGFFSREAVLEHSEPVPPDQERAARWVAGIGTASTAKATAALAVCARVFRRYNPSLAAECERSSRAGWQFLQQHPERVLVDGKGSPQPLWDDGPDYAKEVGARLIAAVETWRSFGVAEALDSARALMRDAETEPAAFSSGAWGNLSRWGLTSLVSDTKTPDDLRRDAATRLLAAVKPWRERIERDGYRCASRPDEYFWGHNSNLLEKTHLMLVARWLYPKEAPPMELARDQWHWILGRNPNGHSMITGVGRGPSRIYHMEWKGLPPPGYLVGGPNGKDAGFLAPGAPAKALLWDNPKPLRSGLPAHSLWHADQRDLWDGGFVPENTWTAGWWTVTEPDIYYNANLVLVAAYLL